MTVDDLLARLEKVSANGDGYSASCPGHNDQKPSLSIREGEDGRVSYEPRCFSCHELPD